ncbi:hypothetical protein D9619_004423 [Psilocybe cf. subviscida]|uniref:Uncharacterized protein n=1 Tax=Psilocybe cf. subviscida TaxID=2480587 RepID=A0A8H5F8V8_9AGAR|nr:hypothetical protein D9619_004423 [Psilocybe cf. subviscida]
MAPEASVLAAHTELPHELYCDIIKNLHYLRDRPTLLRLALVSNAWCIESQRVLFRTVCDDSMDLDKRESVVHTHTFFLKAIIHDPARLGPYVQTYKQHEFTRHPFLAIDSKDPPAGASSYLWDLTENALRAFVNLQHLSIVPTPDYRWSPPASLLDGCTFKLKSLRWGFESNSLRSTGPFVDFLRAQHDLLHLEVGFQPSQSDLSWLPDNFCPSLRSASCRLDCVAHVMNEHRNIAALSVGHPRQPVRQRDLAALCRLQHLSVSAAHRDLASEWGPIDLNVILLELTSWDSATARSLPGLPKLRVLALVREGSSHPYDAMFQMQLTLKGFRQCPNLEYVVIEDTPRVKGQRRYKKLSIAGYNPESDDIPDIQSEEFPVEHEPGKRWWNVYLQYEIM